MVNEPSAAIQLEEVQMHDAAASIIAEYVGLIHDYGKEQGTFHLSVVFDEAGDYSTAFVFGHEAEDSPMAAGASYGYGKTLVEALKGIVDECHLIEKRSDRIREAARARHGYARSHLRHRDPRG